MTTHSKNQLVQIQVIDDNSFDQELVQMSLRNISNKTHLSFASSLEELDKAQQAEKDIVFVILI
jgi:hypothetical protein